MQHRESGQIALIVLLFIVVVLTIGISVATRSTLDVVITRQEQEGSRTFQAAESGLEEALSVGQFGDDEQSADFKDKFSELLSQGTYTIDPVQSGAGSFFLETPTAIAEGGSVQIPIASAVGDLEVYWHENDNCENDPAVLLVRVYAYNSATGSYSATNYGYKCVTSTNPTWFTAGTNGASGYASKLTLTRGSQLPNVDNIIVSIHPLYNDAKIKISGVALSESAVQWNVKSVAKNLDGNETKAVQVVRTLPMYPSIFDYVMYSGTDLVKP